MAAAQFCGSGGITKHLMTGFSGNSAFCFLSTSMFPSASPRGTMRVSGNQNSLFPLWPVTKCLIFHLIRRGRGNIRLLTKESFAVQVDAAGKMLVYQVVNELDKHHRANDQPGDSPGEGRMHDRPRRVPTIQLKLFNLNLSKLNPALSCLWQRPRATNNFGHSEVL